MSRTIAFCATGKTGLGHLRRIANVARAVRKQDPAQPIDLLTNAAVEMLPPEETSLFRRIELMPRQNMANRLVAADCSAVVVDTAVLPGLHAVAGRLCLILRETVAERLAAFRLEEGRAWDLIVLPQPASEWRPDPDLVPARRLEAVGYIYRKPRARRVRRDGVGAPATGPPRMLIASGGGGSDLTSLIFRDQVSRLVEALREETCAPFQVVQALGPRVPELAAVSGADAIWRPGPDLHEAFARADLVISTVGYNSVLELACTDVPVLLVPIARAYDDQEKRAWLWGERLGLCHRPGQPERSVRWMSDVLAARCRRRPVDLGSSGAARCAALLAELAG
jgi:predicted glycosyltransferase